MAKHHFSKGIVGPSDVVIDDEHLHSPAVDMATGRRAFVKSVGLGLVGAAAAASAVSVASGPVQAQAANLDIAILTFALNLEYLEAEFYLRAAAGRGLPDTLTSGPGLGAVSGGHQTPFTDRLIRNYANEVAGDEQAHVGLLRGAIGGGVVGRPAINLFESFTIAARAAGIINQQQTFDPFADDNGFLVAAFLFEDVGVTAYAGAAPLLVSKDYLAAAAGILAVEAYHAGEIRSSLYARGLYTYAQQASDLRNKLVGVNLDQGIGDVNTANIVPTDGNGLVATRTPAQVLNIVYGATSAPGTNPAPGLFFPAGMNGQIR